MRLSVPQRRILQYLANTPPPNLLSLQGNNARTARSLVRMGFAQEPRGRVFTITPEGRSAL